jgi:hypothetical protein
MIRQLVITLVAVVEAGVIGCTSVPKTMPPDRPLEARLSAITSYAQEAAAPHRRAVRKPLRDARALALRNLARQTDALLAETRSLDSDVRLAALAEDERPAAHAATAELRTVLAALRQAAADADLVAVREQHAHVLAAHARLSELAHSPK